MEENLASALCYIPIIGIIFLVMEPYNKNRTIRFHAFQSIFYAIAWIVISIVLGILGGVLAIGLGMYAIWGLLSRLVSLALFVGWIILVYKAYQREKFLMPVIGPLAEKQA
jgi:uncharacterized membrane protein